MEMKPSALLEPSVLSPSGIWAAGGEVLCLFPRCPRTWGEGRALSSPPGPGRSSRAASSGFTRNPQRGHGRLVPETHLKGGSRVDSELLLSLPLSGAAIIKPQSAREALERQRGSPPGSDSGDLGWV